MSAIESVLVENRVFPPTAATVQAARISGMAAYEALCREAEQDFEGFCARIGATHSVVFGGFSAKSLQERIIDAGAVAVITANYQMRGGKEMGLKAIIDEALDMGGCDTVKNVLVYMRTPTACKMVAGRDK